MRLRLILLLALCLAACEAEGEPVGVTAPADTSTSSSTTTTTAGSSTTSRPASTTTSSVPVLGGLGYEVVAEGLDFPMLMMPWTESTSLVAFRDGRIHSFDGTAISPDPLVDLAVATDGERGLLGLEAAGADTVRVHYSDPAGNTVVSEITLSDGAEEVWLTVDQPASNHNGGMLQTGPDGMVYVGLGDGGGSNDRFGHGQNTATLLGGIVRIDPATGEAALWSHGLRNPFRFWFDGDLLYIADVGQNAYEEIDVVAFDPAGYNFGWPITEGLHCFSPQSDCDTGGVTLPVVEVAHGDGGACSITGGVVYRGMAIPEIEGHYFYSDLCGGWLRSFRFDGGVTDQRDWTGDVGNLRSVVSFGVDHTGEMYVITNDAIRRIVPVR